MKTPYRILVTLLLAGLLPTGHAFAGSIYNYETYGNTLDGPVGTPSGTCTAETYVSQTFSLSNCSSATGVTTNAQSTATYTGIHADSSLSLSNVTLPSGITASAYGRTVDTLNVASAGVAYVGFTFDITSDIVDSGLSQARTTFTFGFNYGVPGGVVPVGCSRNISTGSLHQTYTCTTPLFALSIYNQYDYFFSLSTQEFKSGSANPVSGFASASNTATLRSVQAYGADLTYLANAQISSAGNSGSNFQVEPAPEPATVLGGAMSLGLVAWLRRRRAK